MKLQASVFDVWVYRRSGPAGADIEYLLLHASQAKADRYFNGGRFWQIPSNLMADGETVTGAAIACSRASASRRSRSGPPSTSTPSTTEGSTRCR
jgi:hypothetical protein